MPPPYLLLSLPQVLLLLRAKQGIHICVKGMQWESYVGITKISQPWYPCSTWGTLDNIYEACMSIQ